MYGSAIKRIRGPYFNVFWYSHHVIKNEKKISCEQLQTPLFSLQNSSSFFSISYFLFMGLMGCWNRQTFTFGLRAHVFSMPLKELCVC